MMSFIYKCHGFQRRPGDMGFAGPEGQTHDGCPGVHLPVGGAHPTENGEVVDAAVVRRGSDHGLGVGVSDNQAESIPLPFHLGPAGDDDAIKGIVRASLRAPADNGDHAVLGRGGDVARDGKLGAQGAFGLSRVEKAFTKGGRMRVACHVGNGCGIGIQPFKVALPESM